MPVLRAHVHVPTRKPLATRYVQRSHGGGTVLSIRQDREANTLRRLPKPISFDLPLPTCASVNSPSSLQQRLMLSADAHQTLANHTYKFMHAKSTPSAEDLLHLEPGVRFGDIATLHGLSTTRCNAKSGR